MMATFNLSRDQFYDLYKKLQFRVFINSVVKGRHASSEKVCMEYLEVSAEPHNPLDKKAFIVAHVLPGPSGPVYGRVNQKDFKNYSIMWTYFLMRLELYMNYGGK